MRTITYTIPGLSNAGLVAGHPQHAKVVDRVRASQLLCTINKSVLSTTSWPSVV
jgi:hypothetical protein